MTLLSKLAQLSTSQKLIVVSLTAGVALLGVLAQYMKRRKTPRPVRRTRKFVGRRSRNSVRSPNGECPACAAPVAVAGGAGEILLSNRSYRCFNTNSMTSNLEEMPAAQDCSRCGGMKTVTGQQNHTVIGLDDTF